MGSWFRMVAAAVAAFAVSGTAQAAQTTAQIMLGSGNEDIVGPGLSIQRRAAEMGNGAIGVTIRIIAAIEPDALLGQ